MDSDVAQIVSITSTTPERAAQYLQLADGDLDAAVMLFFESNGADPSGGHPSDTSLPSTSTAPRPSATGDTQNSIDVDEDNESSNDDSAKTTARQDSSAVSSSRTRNKAATFDSDAEYARKLQEEMYGGSGGPLAAGEEEIRAPIARQSETLLGPDADIGALEDQEFPAHVMEQMRTMQNRRAPQRIFNQRPTTSAIWNEQGEGDSGSGLLAQSTAGASQASSRSNMLAKMYQPPWDLMYKGGWEGAREEGRGEQKWLLVNIQDGSVFDCQVLNRDLWKNPSVVETVRENFVFLQYSKDDIRAEQYLQYYFHEHSNPDLYPHIAIVDPRTGEQVKVWSAEVPKPGDFLMQLHEFLDRYSLSSHARNPVAKRKPEAKKPKTVDQMTEEEQLERAVQASLAGGATSSEKLRVEDPDELTRSVAEVGTGGATTSQNKSTLGVDSKRAVGPGMENGHETTRRSASPPSPEPSAFDRIPSDRHHAEPAAGSPDVTRIQFRHPGGRIIRRFSIHDPVQRIFEWLKAEPPFRDGTGNQKADATEKERQKGEEEEAAAAATATTTTTAFEFELVSMGRNLIEVADQSIDEAGLKNGTVMIELLQG